MFNLKTMYLSNSLPLPRLLGHHTLPLISRHAYTSIARPQLPTTPLTSILIANRGEIALRIGRTASENGVRTTTIYTDPDAHSLHALSSVSAVNIGGPAAYLDGDKIIEVAKKHGCNGIHPGYGFLSENSKFARKCTEAGLIFIGPPWAAIEAMGNKSRSKTIMNEASVPCIPGYHGSNQSPSYLLAHAQEIGFPVLLKAVHGGGGKGMRIVRTSTDFLSQLTSAKSEALNSFGDDIMLVEKYIQTPRHIEVQIFADKHGNCVALGERDCSIQRRHQKILEESPAPHLSEDVRQNLWAKARAAALAVGYEGAGTVEFIFDTETNEFFFMEMNTRLQVEHPVTEMITGEDLVHWQFIVAEGGKLPLTQAEIEGRIKERGWAIEARIYAENPDTNFTPSSGPLLHNSPPPTSPTLRLDYAFAPTTSLPSSPLIPPPTISSHYDPMIAKLIALGPTRTTAIQKLLLALESYEIAGPTTNIEFLKRVCSHEAFIAGEVETGFIEKWKEHLFEEREIANEVFAQAALGTLLMEEKFRDPRSPAFTESYGQRRLSFTTGMTTTGGKETIVDIKQTGPNLFSLTTNSQTWAPISPTYNHLTKTLSTHYPHTHLVTRLIPSPSTNSLTLFQNGFLYRLTYTPPPFLAKAIGKQEKKNSVLAPMPCKILRVEVKEGDTVGKDQALVVIESMKMETVIRCPGEGMVVRRVVHREGELCKAGTALVEFEE